MKLKKETVLNKTYKVLKFLNKGSMGNVYLVERIKDNKQFVIKELLYTKACGIDENDTREMFFQEAEFLAKFDHHSIPKTYGTFSEENRHYIIMDYIEGKTLEEIINLSDSPILEYKAIQWIIELAEIMDYLHNSFEKPVIYRDLKPSNIIITPDGNVNLIDFGIALYYNPDRNTDTFYCGSPGYAAPEQYKGRGQTKPQTDIFALGVILLQMLTKYDPTIRPLFFPPVKSLNPRISYKLSLIITKAIQLNWLERYICMKEFKQALEKYSGFTCSENTPFEQLQQNSGKKSIFIEIFCWGAIILSVIIVVLLFLFAHGHPIEELLTFEFSIILFLSKLILN